YFYRAAIAAATADADAFRISAAMAERRSAAGAYPLVAAFVALLLLFKQLLEAFLQLVVAEFFQLRQLLGRQFAFHALDQPVQRDLGLLVKDRLYAFEVQAERFVELVIM